MAAYDELVAQGFATAHVGQGTFVAAQASGTEPRHKDATDVESLPGEINWRQCFSRTAQINADSRPPDVSAHRAQGETISFAGGMPDSGLFPTDAFRRVLNQVIREEIGRHTTRHETERHQRVVHRHR